MLRQPTEDPAFMASIVTGDKSWVYGYDPETKVQSSQWKSPDEPRPEKARMNHMTNVKLMLITFFDVRWIIHHKFVEPGTTENALYFKTVLQKIKKVVKKKRGSDYHCFLHHNNVPSHCSLTVQQYLAKKAGRSYPNLQTLQI